LCSSYGHRPAPVPPAELLAKASDTVQRLHLVDGIRAADAGACVFAPNRVGTPQGCSLDYVGAFSYHP
jgi:hypothetical protein